MADAMEIHQLFNDFSKDVLAKFDDVYSKLMNINTCLSNFVEDDHVLNTTVDLICEKEILTTHLEIST